MFASTTRAPGIRQDQSLEFFRRFKDTSGLLHAYFLKGADGFEDAQIVSIWESRDALEEYLRASPLRREVDQVAPVARAMYEVLDSK